MRGRGAMSRPSRAVLATPNSTFLFSGSDQASPALALRSGDSSLEHRFELRRVLALVAVFDVDEEVVEGVFGPVPGDRADLAPRLRRDGGGRGQRPSVRVPELG